MVSNETRLRAVGHRCCVAYFLGYVILIFRLRGTDKGEVITLLCVFFPLKRRNVFVHANSSKIIQIVE